MAYIPHRRHVAASISSAMQVFGLVQYLYHPSLLIFGARTAAQIRVSATAHLRPTHSLLAFTIMLSLMNLVAVLLHLLDFSSGMGGSKGLILDFVGQARPASLSRVLLLDVLLWALQLLSLTVAYTSHRSMSNVKTPSLPYDDLLLPMTLEVDDDPEEDWEAGDIETGREGARRRMNRSSSRGKGMDVMEEVWLDDEDEDRDEAEALAASRASARERLLSSNTGTPRIRIRHPPLVFNLSFQHYFRLLWHLPAPPPPAPAFAGGTPMPTPPQSPAAPTRVLASDDEDEEEDGDELSSPTSGPRSPRGTGARRRSDEVGRIPGDYWIASTRGNGG